MAETFRVLLVEDDKIDAMWVQRSLKEDASSQVRFEIREAATLADGLKLLAQEQWDAILLDLSLPDSPWDETFAKFYVRSETVPIIVLTGVSDKTVAEDCVVNGAVKYLLKGKTDGPMLCRALLEVVKKG